MSTSFEIETRSKMQQAMEGKISLVEALCLTGESENRCLDNILNAFHRDESSVVNEDNLRALAEAIAPSESTVSDAKSVATAVVHATKECTGHHIDRSVIFGSLAKNTSLIFPDIDLTVFVNDIGAPPYTHILQGLPECLEERLPGLSTEAETLWNIKVRYGGFDVDLTPTRNFALGEASTPDKSRFVQHKKCLEKLRTIQWEETKEFQFQSSFIGDALSEAKVQKWEGQPKIAHNAARLTKLWSKTCLLKASPYLNLTSVLFESIALAVAEEEVLNNSSERSLVEVMKNILRALTTPEDIVLLDNNNPGDIPSWIAAQRPLILDINPAQNKANAIMDWDPILSAAASTLDILERETEDNPGTYTVKDVFACSEYIGPFDIGIEQM